MAELSNSRSALDEDPDIGQRDHSELDSLSKEEKKSTKDRNFVHRRLRE